MHGDTAAMPTLQPATPEFVDTAPLRVVSEVTVLAPIDVCWRYIADQASWVQWFNDMSAVHATPWVWTEPGQTRKVTVNGMVVHETCISMVPEVEYAFTINKWPLPTATRVAEAIRLEDLTNRGSARTKLTYIGAIESNAAGRLSERLLEKQLSTAWTGALQTLGKLAARKAA